ncbi:BgTH12-00485 [Blumeria graminis f. sp. triticale]|uniref:BgTH12-00485 n=1 Tax=Blumeria graminis f. sp. triticale TaxID=1689686 RepID=A0A9W4DR66_BLUGR|nr:BgTH12-00485 [Blumeria graminis f. sp. triticale]
MLKWTKLVTKYPINNALALEPIGFEVFNPNLAPQPYRKAEMLAPYPRITFDLAIEKTFATEKGLYVLPGKIGRWYQLAQPTRTKTELLSVLPSTNLGVKKFLEEELN